MNIVFSAEINDLIWFLYVDYIKWQQNKVSTGSFVAGSFFAGKNFVAPHEIELYCIDYKVYDFNFINGIINRVYFLEH